MLKYKNRSGDINISDDVIASISGNAVTNSYGIAGMVSKENAIDTIVSLFKGKNTNKGISVSVENDEVSAVIHIAVTYGVNIMAISESITHNAKYAIESATGFKVKEINVFVDSIKA